MDAIGYAIKAPSDNSPQVPFHEEFKTYLAEVGPALQEFEAAAARQHRAGREATEVEDLLSGASAEGMDPRMFTADYRLQDHEIFHQSLRETYQKKELYRSQMDRVESLLFSVLRTRLPELNRVMQGASQLVPHMDRALATTNDIKLSLKMVYKQRVSRLLHASLLKERRRRMSRLLERLQDLTAAVRVLPSLQALTDASQRVDFSVAVAMTRTLDGLLTSPDSNLRSITATVGLQKSLQEVKAAIAQRLEMDVSVAVSKNVLAAADGTEPPRGSSPDAPPPAFVPTHDAFAAIWADVAALGATPTGENARALWLRGVGTEPAAENVVSLVQMRLLYSSMMTVRELLKKGVKKAVRSCMQAYVAAHRPASASISAEPSPERSASVASGDTGEPYLHTVVQEYSAEEFNAFWAHMLGASLALSVRVIAAHARMLLCVADGMRTVLGEDDGSGSEAGVRASLLITGAGMVAEQAAVSGESVAAMFVARLGSVLGARLDRAQDLTVRGAVKTASSAHTFGRAITDLFVAGRAFLASCTSAVAEAATQAVPAVSVPPVPAILADPEAARAAVHAARITRGVSQVVTNQVRLALSSFQQIKSEQLVFAFSQETFNAPGPVLEPAMSALLQRSLGAGQCEPCEFNGLAALRVDERPCFVVPAGFSLAQVTAEALVALRSLPAEYGPLVVSVLHGLFVAASKAVADSILKGEAVANGVLKRITAKHLCFAAHTFQFQAALLRVLADALPTPAPDPEGFVSMLAGDGPLHTGALVALSVVTDGLHARVLAKLSALLIDRFRQAVPPWLQQPNAHSPDWSGAIIQADCDVALLATPAGPHLALTGPWPPAHQALQAFQKDAAALARVVAAHMDARSLERVYARIFMHLPQPVHAALFPSEVPDAEGSDSPEHSAATPPPSARPAPMDVVVPPGRLVLDALHLYGILEVDVARPLLLRAIKEILQLITRFAPVPIGMSRLASRVSTGGAEGSPAHTSARLPLSPGPSTAPLLSEASPPSGAAAARRATEPAAETRVLTAPEAPEPTVTPLPAPSEPEAAQATASGFLAKAAASSRVAVESAFAGALAALPTSEAVPPTPEPEESGCSTPIVR